MPRTDNPKLITLLPALLRLCLPAFVLSMGFASAQAQNQFDPASEVEKQDQLYGQLTAISEDTEALISMDERQLTLQIEETEGVANTAKRQAAECIASIRPLVIKLTEEQALLPALVPEENIALWEQRTQINEQLSAAQARLSGCELLFARAESVISQGERLKSMVSSIRLSARQEPLWAFIGQIPRLVKAWPERLDQAIRVPRNDTYAETDIVPAMTVVLLLGIALGLLVRFRFYRWYNRTGAAEQPASLKFLLPKPLADYAPWLITGALCWIALATVAEKPSLDYLAIRVAVAIFTVGLGLVLIDWSTGPLSAGARIDGLYPERVTPMRRRMRWMLGSIAFSVAFIGYGALIRLVRRPGELDVLLWLVLALWISTALLSLLMLARQMPGLHDRSRFIRVLIVILIGAGLFAELAGYYNFAYYIFSGLSRSALAIFLLWMSLWAIEVTVREIRRGKTAFAVQTRTFLGITPEGKHTLLGIYQAVAELSLWMSFLIFMVQIWDTTETLLDSFSSFFLDGVEVSGTRFIPADILTAVAMFIALIMLTGWSKRWIETRWLRHMNLDRGARDALMAMVGYVGFIIAAIVALRFSGVSVASLAIIAGALSVGIGFGLQSIANNFISGLILLFERPIKSGDFVTIAGVEGFVRKISIRSTEIETLDRRNVIVPNSELISGQVTNWVLRDPHGRLTLNVGVAYGSDVELVQKLLVEAAMEHPDVIKEGRAPGPKALFMAFGESSLDFELRIWIHRIEKRFDVVSGVNFAIDKAFRAHGIQIPFPQRDLHVRSWEPSATPVIPGKAADPD
ncbi:MAG: mechanosensitive ion channel [Gammaproteobacteria bacterium]|nr:mechanosensitive ion channel [Gammaproteobacteria bacterium]